MLLGCAVRSDAASPVSKPIVIGEIRVTHGPLFDPRDPVYGHFPYTWMEAFHVTTRDWVVQQGLLLRSGDPLDSTQLRDSERSLRRLGFLNCDSILIIPKTHGVVDLEVLTADTWSLSLGGAMSRTSGFLEYSAKVEEGNLLGSGVLIGLSGGRKNQQWQGEGYTSVVNLGGSFVDLSLGYRLTNPDGHRLLLKAAKRNVSESALFDWSIYYLDNRNLETALNQLIYTDYFLAQQRRSINFGLHPGNPSGFHYLFGGEVNRVAVTPILPNKLVSLIPLDNLSIGGGVIYRTVLWTTIEGVDNAFHKEDLANGWQAGFLINGVNGNYGRLDNPLWQHGFVEASLSPEPVYLGFKVSEMGYLTDHGQSLKTEVLVRGFWKPQDFLTWAFHLDYTRQAIAGTEAVPLALGENIGLRGLSANQLQGDRYLMVNTELRAMSPWVILTGTPGIAGFMDAGMIRTASGWIAAANLGIGLRVGLSTTFTGRMARLDFAIPLTRNTAWRIQFSSELPFESYSTLSLPTPLPE